MKNVVFEGVINGKKFDTVESYNDEINRLINEGCNNIDASSSTKIQEVPDLEVCCCEECGSNECSCKEPTPEINLTPMFEGDKHYLDVLVTRDSNENAAILSDLKGATNRWAREIVSHLRSASKDDILSYIKDVNGIVDLISHDRDDTRKAFVTLSEDLENAKNDLARAQAQYDVLNEKMNILNDCNPVMDTLQEFYERMRVAAQDVFNEGPDTPRPLPKSAMTTEGFLNWIGSLLR